MIDYDLLSKSILFKDLLPDEISKILSCLSAEEKTYKKDEIIYHSGDIISSFGLVLTGSVYIENDDFWGNHSIIDHITPGVVFAETYSLLENEPLLVNVRAAKDSTILFLISSLVVNKCPNGCTHHQNLIRNLLTITTRKNINLSRRILCTTPKSIRSRLLIYLSSQCTINNSYEFDIPLNRQELADYLNVDRSALSNELSKMQAEGLIRFHKNNFHLIKELQ